MRKTEALRARNDVEVCKELSEVYNLLTPKNQQFYQIILKEYGLLPEQIYANTQRLGKNNNTGVSQNNLEHIRDGLLLVERLKEIFEGHWTVELPEGFWDDIQLAWLLHDIGEWGMKFDVTTDLKNDQQVSFDDIEEKEKGLRIIATLEDGDLETRCRALYLLFEDRIEYGPGGRIIDHNLLGCIVRFIDKWEPIEFNLESGVTKHRRQNRKNFCADVRRNSFGKAITPAVIIAQYLDHQGINKLKQIIYNEINDYKEVFSGRLEGRIRNMVHNQIRFKPGIKTRQSSFELGKLEVI